MNLAYARVSTDEQTNENQRLEICRYCEARQIKIDKFLEVEQSSRKSQEKRKILVLKRLLKKGDLLLVCELSRLSRDMLESVNLVLNLTNKGVKIVFIRQPELNSIKQSAFKLMIAFYGYIAETEREYISQRTKAGLERAKLSGKKLGRPYGTLHSIYDNCLNEIKKKIDEQYLCKQIWHYLNRNFNDNKPISSFPNFWSFCKRRNLKFDF